MRVALYLIVLVIVAVLIVPGGNTLSGATEAPSASPSPSATPTTTLPPVAVPASAGLVHWARSWRRAAVRAWTKWNRARWCLSMPHGPFSSPRPRQSASKAMWMTSGRHWRAMRRDYRHRTRILVHSMCDPGGGGTTRWIPLLKWTGWPAGAIPGAMLVMGRESSGSPHRWNRGGSPCFGFFQIHRCWWGARGFAWIYRAINQARLAWHIYHDVQHDSWLPAWAATY